MKRGTVVYDGRKANVLFNDTFTFTFYLWLYDVRRMGKGLWREPEGKPNAKTTWATLFDWGWGGV